MIINRFLHVYISLIILFSFPLNSSRDENDFQPNQSISHGLSPHFSENPAASSYVDPSLKKSYKLIYEMGYTPQKFDIDWVVIRFQDSAGRTVVGRTKGWRQGYKLPFYTVYDPRNLYVTRGRSNPERPVEEQHIINYDSHYPLWPSEIQLAQHDTPIDLLVQFYRNNAITGEQRILLVPASIDSTLNEIGIHSSTRQYCNPNVIRFSTPEELVTLPSLDIMAQPHVVFYRDSRNAPTTNAFIEIEEPLSMLHGRTQHAEPSENNQFYAMPPFSHPSLQQCRYEINDFSDFSKPFTIHFSADSLHKPTIQLTAYSNLFIKPSDRSTRLNQPPVNIEINPWKLDPNNSHIYLMHVNANEINNLSNIDSNTIPFSTAEELEFHNPNKEGRKAKGKQKK